MQGHLRVGFSWGGPLTWAIPENRKAEYLTPTPNFKAGSDLYWMYQAFQESIHSVGITSPNPAVGCVLVDRNHIEIARGRTQRYRGKHAEAMAFESVVDPSRLHGASLYVTLEPCASQGHQPPCLDLVLNSPIQRIVISREDPNPLTRGRSIEAFREAGKEVVVGPLAAETSAWNFAFIQAHERNLDRPVYGLKWAQTLDGQLVDDTGHSKWITSPTARAYSHWLRQKYDGILVGAGTLLMDLPSLDARDCHLPHQADPMPIVIDPKDRCAHASAKQQAVLLKNALSSHRKAVLFCPENSIAESSWLESHPNILILKIPQEILDPRVHTSGTSPIFCRSFSAEISSQLRSASVTEHLGRKIQSVFIEGGPQTLRLFLQGEHADVLHVFVAPKISGGTKGRIQLFRNLEDAAQFKILSSAQLGPDVLLEMTPNSVSGK